MVEPITLMKMVIRQLVPKKLMEHGIILINYGELIKNNFASDGRYYDKYGKQVDFGRNRYFELNGENGTMLEMMVLF